MGREKRIGRGGVSSLVWEETSSVWLCVVLVVGGVDVLTEGQGDERCEVVGSVEGEGLDHV